MERKLQLATSLAFLALCLVGVALGVKSLISRPVPSTGGAAARSLPLPPPPPMYKVGDRVSIKGVDFSAADQTLVLVVRKGCRYCDESMPFYRQLGDDAVLAKRTRIVLAAPEDETISREELAKQNVRVDQVVKVVPGQLKVRGTPTTIVVDQSGAVKQVTTGLLNELKQKELLIALKGIGRP